MIKILIIFLISNMLLATGKDVPKKHSRLSANRQSAATQPAKQPFDCGNLRNFFFEVGKTKVKSKIYFPGQIYLNDLPISNELGSITFEQLIAAYKVFGAKAKMTSKTTEEQLAVYIAQGFVDENSPCLNLSELSLFWQGFVRSELLNKPFYVMSTFLDHIHPKLFYEFFIYELSQILQGDRKFLVNLITEKYSNDRKKISSEFMEIYTMIHTKTKSLEDGAEMRYIVKMAKYIITTERIFACLFILQNLKKFITTKEPSIFNWLIDNVILYQITAAIDKFADRFKSIEAQSYFSGLKNHFTFVKNGLDLETRSISSLMNIASENYGKAKKCLQCKIDEMVKKHEKERKGEDELVQEVSPLKSPVKGKKMESSVILENELKEQSTQPSYKNETPSKKKGILDTVASFFSKPFNWLGRRNEEIKAD